VQPYGRPTHELTAALTLRPLDKLALAFDYHLAAGRKVLLYGYNEEMKDINELNLTASYTLNNTFGVYLKTKNLLFQRYAEFYGYPLQNFSIMAGVNINF
jgi:outer membrane cobalamin receptor